MPAEIVDLNEKRLSKLDPEEIAGALMRLPAKRRIEVILKRPDSEAVVAALDANDFFHTVQEIGPDDSLPVLALASLEQLNHLFDIEWWRKDAMEPAKSLTWLERLARANEQKLIQWLYNADFELLVSLFKEWIVVDIVPEDIDLAEAKDSLPPRSLDDVYFWESRYPQYDDLIMHLLSTIFEINYGFFKELMNSVLYAPSPEIEESAYRFHLGRLADHAIPEFYEALEIYKALKPDEFGEKKVLPGADAEHSPPSFALALVPQGDLLGQVLRQIENPDLIEFLQFEMASLANKVVVADQVATDNAESLRNGVAKALAYVNLGLEMQSGGSLQTAARIIGNTFLEHLFRLAHAEIARIRGRLQAVVKQGWLAESPTGIKCLDGEWLDAAEQLLAKNPRLPREKSDEEAFTANPRFDFFRTPEDLVRGNHIVDVITAAGHLFGVEGADPKALERKLWDQGQIQRIEDITVGVMLFTAAAGFLTNGDWIVSPLEVSNWPGLFSSLQPANMEKAIVEWVHETIPDPQKRVLAESYIRPLLRDYDFEMRPFSDHNPPEPQLVKFFLFRG
jgi:hypothetical protein